MDEKIDAQVNVVLDLLEELPLLKELNERIEKIKEDQEFIQNLKEFSKIKEEYSKRKKELKEQLEKNETFIQYKAKEKELLHLTFTLTEKLKSLQDEKK